jgi:hypothetical protein
MEKLTKSCGIGAAIAAVAAIAAYLLPTPHAHSQVFSYLFGPGGALAGYGLAALLTVRASTWSTRKLVTVAAISLVGTIICGSLYFNLYWLDPSPGFGARLLHAILYGFTFAFFFFTARWAGFLLPEGKAKENPIS